MQFLVLFTEFDGWNSYLLTFFQVSPISEFCSFQICRTEIGNFVKTQTQGSQDWIRRNFYIILDIRSAENKKSKAESDVLQIKVWFVSFQFVFFKFYWSGIWFLLNSNIKYIKILYIKPVDKARILKYRSILSSYLCLFVIWWWWWCFDWLAGWSVWTRQSRCWKFPSIPTSTIVREAEY